VTNKANLILPIVHLNGTSANDLVDQRATAIDALHAAGDALAKMAPNGRDYYPVPGLMPQAVDQHERRMNSLKALIHEIEMEMLAVSDLRSNHERAKRHSDV
jgi:hypothetical protein